MKKFYFKMYINRLRISSSGLVCKDSAIRIHTRDFRSGTCDLKNVSGSFPKAYNPDDVEFGWYKWWLDRNCFQSTSAKDANVAGEKIFSMVLPPPNVTGDLHLGHALAITIEDVLIRWHKAKGFHTLWIPGYDHAGIATQVVVEKKIKAQTGRARHELSRDEFIKEGNMWKNEKIANIRQQLQKLGSSLDWSRECFTMDKDFAFAVEEAFIRLHQDGLIKREKSLVNWCCYLQSAISDMEVDNVNVKSNSTYRVPGYDKPIEVGKLTHFAYRLVNSKNKEELVVATSRPETVFGDVAVAVNPMDHRYSQWIGQHVCHPLDGRILPIIADETVDSKFGTGCVKVTPAHDYRDFEMAKKHGLDFLNIMDKKGNLVTDVEVFKGMPRFEARKAVIEELKRLGLFRGQQGYESTLPICSRSGDIIEPLLYPQWYVDCSKMFSELVQDIETGQFILEPDFARNILLHWLSQKRKWCISRQLWWGHQIPAYLVKDSQNNDEEDDGSIWVVGRTIDDAVKEATLKLGRPVASDCLIRDEDVLDTWFSSALFPFAVFGWPKKELDISFKKFYPLSLMETGHDIIFFWVARMAILGHKLTGVRPFNKVLVHGLICDSHGRKMSKSLGNVIDPNHVLQGASLQDLYRRSESFYEDGYISQKELETSKLALARDFPSGIPRCGADALRFALLSQNVKNQFINMDVAHVHSCTKFCNKIWQACKFYLLALEKTNLKVQPLDQVQPSLFDKWILNRLYMSIQECNSNFKTYDFHLVTKALHNFWYFSLCDFYLEGIKPVLYGSAKSSDADKEAAISTLYSCLRTATISLAPIMPFLTEELYHRLRMNFEGNIQSVSEEPYPKAEQWESWNNPELEEAFSHVIAIIAELRRIRDELGISQTKPEVIINDCNIESKVNKFHLQLETMSKFTVTFINGVADLPINYIRRSVSPDISLALKIESGSVYLNQAIERMIHRQNKIKKELDQLCKKAEQPYYSKNMTDEMLQKHQDKISYLKSTLLQIESSIDDLKVMNQD